MPAPIEETTSQLIERARAHLAAKMKEAQTDAHRGSLAFWFIAPGVCAGAFLATTGAKVETYSQHVKWSGVALAIVAGMIAVAVVLCLSQVYMRTIVRLKSAEAKAQKLHWLETQARDGLLTDAEVRTEVLQVMR